MRRKWRIKGDHTGTIYNQIAACGEFLWLKAPDRDPITVKAINAAPHFETAEMWANVYADGYVGRWEVSRLAADKWYGDYMKASRVGVMHLHTDGSTTIEPAF
jgi:hypothetical protein